MSLASKACPACGSPQNAFTPLAASYAQSLQADGFPYPVEAFETLNLAEYFCPSCGASDRDRLMALYFLRYWIEEGRAGDARVLQIAPSKPLERLVRDFCGGYRSGDLMAGFAMDQVDITDMRGYATGVFDLVFCSHVLEHVIDDGAALRELRRVLARGGEAALLVPIVRGLTVTDEVRADEPMPDAAERVRRFAQDDHVRLYAKADFESRIVAAGFALRTLTATDFPDDDLEAFGIARGSVLYVATNPG